MNGIKSELFAHVSGVIRLERSVSVEYILISGEPALELIFKVKWMKLFHLSSKLRQIYRNCDADTYVESFSSQQDVSIDKRFLEKLPIVSHYI